MKIRWCGHAGFMIETAGKVVYIDPYVIQEDPGKADIILVTHDHYDHCELSNIRKLRKPHTAVIASSGAARKIGLGAAVARVGDVLHMDGVDVSAVHAYNIEKHYHRKGEGLGFIIESEGKRIYHSGDSDFIPEMKSLGVIDVALMAVGGMYTMDAREAADAVKVIKPGIAVPMHWGTTVGSQEDAELFRRIVGRESGTRVVILGEGELEV